MDFYRLLPIYWTQNTKTSDVWDKHLNHLLDTVGVTSVGYFTCKIGDVEVWIENWPYAYGSLYGGGSGLPKVKTRKRLREAVENFIYEKLMGSHNKAFGNK